MRRFSVDVVALLTVAVFLLAAAGCGGKEATISQEQHSQIQREMTLDQVEAITGEPVRTHRTGSPQNPDIIWYFEKTEGAGLVRITFIGGKVESVSPYEESVEPEE